MFLLALGLAVLIIPHLAKRLLPVTYREWGRGGQVAMGVTSILGTVLMIIGYRSTSGVFYWGRTPALVGINNLLMLVAVYLFAAHGMKTWIARQIRWPMVWGVILWAVAHLLVNGDTPSFLLFGGLGIWSLLHMGLMAKTSGPWRHRGRALRPWLSDLWVNRCAFTAFCPTTTPRPFVTRCPMPCPKAGSFTARRPMRLTRAMA